MQTDSDPKPTLHVVGVFHTIHNQEFSHCAFTGKALRFAKMMRMRGYKVIEYANEGSESEADEKVPMIPAGKYWEMWGDRNDKMFHGDLATIGNPMHHAFEQVLIPAIQARLQKGDIVCHVFGHAHETLTHMFGHVSHVETGIGYPTLMAKSFKIFESQAWRHYHMGQAGRSGLNYEWVVPNYYDLDEWDVRTEPGEYVAFMGRIGQSKGMATIAEITRRINLPIVLCGQGDPTPWAHKNIIYGGPLKGRERSDFIGKAICSLMPTEFVEPFGGSGVEGMLCGTPLVAVDYGAFTETVIDGVTGFRCKTLREWLDAIEACKHLDRGTVAAHARATYSLQACSKLYDRAFRMIRDLNGPGWYTGC